MEVRLKTGRYAGQLQDVRPDCARQMIADGRASDPRFEGEFASGGIVPMTSDHGVYLPLPGETILSAAQAKRFREKKGRS